MGVMRPLTIEDVLEVRIDGIAFDGVQFTDDTFDGELVVTNRGDERLVGTIEIVNESETTLGSDVGSLGRESVEVDLDPGETRRVPVGGRGLVGGAGSAVLVGIAEPEIDEPDDGPRRIAPGDRFAALASMVFWDRDFYRVNYQRPRRAQYLSVLFALLSALLAGVIVLVSA